jgi:hypothetical protein
LFQSTIIDVEPNKLLISNTPQTTPINTTTPNKLNLPNTSPTQISSLVRICYKGCLLHAGNFFTSVKPRGGEWVRREEGEGGEIPIYVYQSVASD